MKNPDNREIMARYYRVLEHYEEAPEDAFEYIEDAQAYFVGLLEELRGVWEQYKDSAMAVEIGMGIYSGLQEAYQKLMTHELKHREADHEEAS